MEKEIVSFCLSEFDIFNSYMVDCIQHDCQFLPLALFWLSHLEYVQDVARQLFPQLVQHLTIVQILFDVVDDDALLDELVVDPTR